MTTQRTYTITEAAHATGATPKAIRRRIERGRLESVLSHDGRRRIPLTSLVLAGLLHPDGTPTGAPRQSPTPSHPESPTPGAPTGDIIELFKEHAAAIERAAKAEAQAQIAGLLQAQAESHATTLQAELVEARATVTQLEAQLAQAHHPRRRWFGLARRHTPG
jgi:hypothetical protein